MENTAYLTTLNYYWWFLTWYVLFFPMFQHNMMLLLVQLKTKGTVKIETDNLLHREEIIQWSFLALRELNLC